MPMTRPMPTAMTPTAIESRARPAAARRRRGRGVGAEPMRQRRAAAAWSPCRSRPASGASRRARAAAASSKQQHQHRADRRSCGWQRALPEARRVQDRRRGDRNGVIVLVARTRGSMTAYSTSTTKLTTTTTAASSITQLRTTIRSRLEIDLEDQAAEPGQVEHVLDHDGAGEQFGELQAHDRDHRDHRVAQHMAPHHAAPRHALGAGRAHEILAQHFQHRRARDARQDRGLHHGQRDAPAAAAP